VSLDESFRRTLVGLKQVRVRRRRVVGVEFQTNPRGVEATTPVPRSAGTSRFRRTLVGLKQEGFKEAEDFLRVSDEPSWG